MKGKKHREHIPYYSNLEGPNHGAGSSMADPLGSYTGVPVFDDEMPVQDADDL